MHIKYYDRIYFPYCLSCTVQGKYWYLHGHLRSPHEAASLIIRSHENKPQPTVCGAILLRSCSEEYANQY